MHQQNLIINQQLSKPQNTPIQQNIPLTSNPMSPRNVVYSVNSQ